MVDGEEREGVPARARGARAGWVSVARPLGRGGNGRTRVPALGQPAPTGGRSDPAGLSAGSADADGGGRRGEKGVDAKPRGGFMDRLDPAAVESPPSLFLAAAVRAGTARTAVAAAAVDRVRGSVMAWVSLLGRSASRGEGRGERAETALALRRNAVQGSGTGVMKEPRQHTLRIAPMSAER